MKKAGGRKAKKPQISISDPFRVTVDYAMSPAEMIEAGKYDNFGRFLRRFNFPIDASESGEVEVVLVHLGRYTYTEEILAELKRRKMRPATFAELCAIGAAHPDLQKQFSIAALGSRWQRRPFRDDLVPVLRGGDYGRFLFLCWLVICGWEGCWRFAAVRK